MKKLRNSVENSSSVSIRKGSLQKDATKTNRHEKTQTTTLTLETLRAIARIVRAIDSRLPKQADGRLDTPIAISPHGDSAATNCQDGSQGHEGKNQEKP
jgi:hypothetical protein